MYSCLGKGIIRVGTESEVQSFPTILLEPTQTAR